MTLKLLFFSVVCGSIAIIFKYISYNSIIPSLNLILFNTKSENDVKLFTKDDLKKFDGSTEKNIYVSVLGTVYDVTKAEKHYGPGRPYHVFAGKDASKSFITGNFNENEVTDDISDLSPKELLSIKQWKNFYDKEYTKIGLLIGRYYDSDGLPSQYFKIIETLIERGEKLKMDDNLDEQNYPPCNIEWNQNTGTKVWCSNKSGGVARNWIGYPRKYFKPGSDSFRCACVKDLEDPKVKQYEDCEYHSRSCFIINVY